MKGWPTCGALDA